jgi:hypothetical protein
VPVLRWAVTDVGIRVITVSPLTDTLLAVMS